MPATHALFGKSALSSVSSVSGLSTWSRPPGLPSFLPGLSATRQYGGAGPAVSRQSAGKTAGRLAVLLDRVAHGRERVVLTRRGKSLAAMVPLEDMRVLEALEDRADVLDARAALAENGEHRAWEDVREVLGL